MSKITSKASNIICLSIAITIISAVGSIIYLGCQKNPTPILSSLTLIGSFIGAFATLIAAYIASLLFNDWRIEKNYELESSLLKDTLLDLKPIFIEIHQIRSDSQNLKKITNCLIIKTDYLNRERIDIYKSIISLYPNIKIYSELTNNKELLEIYNNFDKYLFCLDDFYNELFKTRYRRYYERYLEIIDPSKSKIKDSYNIFRSINPSLIDTSLIVSTAEITKFFTPNYLTAKLGDHDTNVTFDDFLEETIKLHNKIQDYCIERLKESLSTQKKPTLNAGFIHNQNS